MLLRTPTAPARAVNILLVPLVLFLSFAHAQLPPDPARGDLRFVVFGDFNGSYGSLDYPAAVSATMQAITKVWRPDLLLSPGDVIAGQNRSLPDARFGEMWEVFDREVAAPLRGAGIPYAVALGNHDGSSLRGPDGELLFARERKAAQEYWSQPMYDFNLDFIARERHPFDHAFRFAGAFVVVLDASSAEVTPEQRAWLERVLELPAARSARLRIVMGHLPLVPVGRGRAGAGEFLTEASELRRIMESGSTDLYISGHHAAYYPGRLGELELLFAGGVGARHLLAGNAQPRSTVTVVDVWMEPLAVRYSTFDVATMELVPSISLPNTIGAGNLEVELSQRGRSSPTAEADAEMRQ